MLSDGYDRFIYTEAMERHLEGKFIWRKCKGERTGAVILGLRKNFETVSTLLCEGHFVKRKYVDQEKLKHALLQVKHGNIEPLWPLMNLYVVEQWLKSWNF